MNGCPSVTSNVPVIKNMAHFAESERSESDDVPQSEPETDHEDSDCERTNDYDELQASLYALTTHFAQIQFRIQQIIDATPDDRESMLGSLKEFAFRSIPNIGSISEISRRPALNQKYHEKIERLKTQLTELEQYAYEAGQAGLPQSVLIQQQQYILNELKTKINLHISGNINRNLSQAEIDRTISLALKEFTDPLKMDEYLILQLKTQVSDLERFVEYLQRQSNGKPTSCACGCAFHSVKKTRFGITETVTLMQKATAVLQMFAALELGTRFNSTNFAWNNFNKSKNFPHWGDTRSRFEMAVTHIKELHASNEPISSNLLIFAVRKHLCTTLRDLIQHGSKAPTHQSNILVPALLGCLSKRILTYPNSHNKRQTQQLHAWQIIVAYYEYKNGSKYELNPSKRLSQSFNLDGDNSASRSHKHQLLHTIGAIVSKPIPFKRSCSAQFKSFVCIALNKNKLATWMHCIFSCQPFVKEYYYSWSYASRTSFHDALRTLDGLTCYEFSLPTDILVRDLNANDAFL